MLYRVYREEGLSLRYRPGRRSKAQVTRPQRKPACRPNQVWSLDFIADQLSNGNRFRCLTSVDVFTRECLAIEVGQGLSGTDVVATLNRIRQRRRLLERYYAFGADVFVPLKAAANCRIQEPWQR
jgi:putative transposase